MVRRGPISQDVILDDIKLETKTTAVESSKPTIPKIKSGDKVSFDNDTTVTINDIPYKGIALETNLNTLVTNRIKTGDFEVIFISKGSTYIAYDNSLLSNPKRTLSEMKVFYQDRYAVFVNEPVFFQFDPVNLSSATLGTLELKSNCFIRIGQEAQPIQDGFQFDKQFFVNDPGYVNKLAYLLYGDAYNSNNLDKAAQYVETLKNEVSPEYVTDTYVPAVEQEYDNYMKKMLDQWGVSYEGLSRQQLRDLYELERQKRIPKATGSNSQKEKIKPYDIDPLTVPSIVDKDLPETGFRKYAPKIMLFTAIAIGTTFYMKFRKTAKKTVNETVVGEF